MTQDEIIRMAREAGFEVDDPLFPIDAEEMQVIERFAALVAAHEREEAYQRGFKRGASIEREACAKVCDDGPALLPAYACAAAIRAR